MEFVVLMNRSPTVTVMPWSMWIVFCVQTLNCEVELFKSKEGLFLKRRYILKDSELISLLFQWTILKKVKEALKYIQCIEHWIEYEKTHVRYTTLYHCRNPSFIRNFRLNYRLCKQQICSGFIISEILMSHSSRQKQHLVFMQSFGRVTLAEKRWLLRRSLFKSDFISTVFSLMTNHSFFTNFILFLFIYW